jgi:predicted Zn-dependent peptidase
MEVVADLMLRPTLAPADLAQEVGVIAQEIAEAADTPDDFVFELAQGAAFAGQPLGRPVLGTEASIGAADPAMLEAWRARLYAPDQVVVSAAGAIDEDELLQLAERLFGVAETRDPLAPATAAFTGGRAAEARRLEQAHLVLFLPGVGATDPDYFAVRVFTEALGGGMSSRLFQEARERLGLAYAIDAFAESYQDTGLIGVYAGCAAKDATALAKVVAAEFHKLAQGVGGAELARAKAQLKAALFMARESLSARAEQAAAQLLVFGRLLTTQEIAEAIDAVDADDLSRLAGRLMAPKLSAPAVLGPSRALGAADAFHQAMFS